MDIKELNELHELRAKVHEAVMSIEVCSGCGRVSECTPEHEFLFCADCFFGIRRYDGDK